MLGRARQRIVRRLPAVGLRASELEERRQEVADLRRRLRDLNKQAALVLAGEADAAKRPSFHRELEGLVRSQLALHRLDRDRIHPHHQLLRKLGSYRLAASHGVQVPTVFASWRHRRDIELAVLPDEFVLKSDGGHSGRNVYPLRRVGVDAYELLDRTRRLSGGELVDELAGSRPPFFAEEVLAQPDGGPLPDDVKVYAAYGEVLHVMLRRMPEHANTSTALYRHVDAEGRDLGDIAPGRRYDPTIASPRRLEEVVDVARHLSRAVGIPFCRVDLYDTTDGVVLGELTPRPGGSQRFRPQHDAWLGARWEEARWRLELDLLAGRPPGILHGDHPSPNLYPKGHVSWTDAPGWAVRQAACEHWC